MSTPFRTRHSINAIKSIIAGLMLTVSLNTHAAVTDLAPAPLVTTPSASVLPNVFLMMDDSGSMAWDYMPDNAGNFSSGTYGAASNQCNGIYYDPNTVYVPPVDSTGVSYPASTFTSAWKDGYNTATGGSTNLSTSFVDTGGDPAQPAFYYTYTGTQTTAKLKDYYNTNSTFYLECNAPVSTGTTATITVGGSGSTTVNSVTVNGVTITSGATTASNRTRTVASSIAAAITVAPYSATSSGSVVTITGTAADLGRLPVVSNNGGGMTFTVTAFSSAPFTKVVVGAAEQQNFANWYSYYRTRILMMKTATGLAFKTIGSNFRVGMATMNNNTTADYLGLAPFTATQKTNWYAKLYATKAGSSTPLREALANVGKMYAMKLPSNKLNGFTVVDPIEYACQQNFTILTTDGFWNQAVTNNPCNNATNCALAAKLTAGNIGEQDGTEQRPMYDGAIQSKSTSQTLETDLQTTSSTSQLQSRIRQTQQQTSQLQTQTSQLQTQTSTLQQSNGTLLSSTGTLQGTLSKVLMKCSGSYAACGSAPATGIANASWSVVTSGSCTSSATLQCQLVSGLSSVVNVAGNCNTSATATQTSAAQMVLTISGITGNPPGTTVITSLQIDGVETMTGSTPVETTSATLATAIATAIGLNGFTATASGTSVIISSPNIHAASAITMLAGTTNSGASFLYSASSLSYTLSNADTNGNIYSSCTYNWSAPAPSASCTYNNASATPNNTTQTTATQCSYTWSAPAPVASCTAVAPTSATTTGTVYTANPVTCAYTPWSAWAGTPTCTAAAQSAGPTSYTVGTARQCQTIVTSPWAGTPACTASATPDASGNTTQCQTVVTSPWAGTPTCTATTTPNASGNTTQCQTVVTSPWAGTPTCAATTTPDVSGNTTQCQTVVTSLWANAATCTATTPNASGFSTQCQTTDTGWVPASSCTATGTPAATYATPDATGKLVNCQTITTGPTPVASCTAIAASAGNSYTATTCGTNNHVNVPVASCTPASPTAANSYVTTTCNTVTTGPTQTTNCIADAASAANSWTTTACTAVSGGTFDTLADVAEYYYMTDLRSTALGNNLSGAPGAVNGTDISANIVPSSGLDTAANQHMTTFTIGLGARGRMVFDPNYQSPSLSSGDFYSVKNGSIANAATGVCSWQADNTICDWPVPANNAIENVDDLWHAAVNGRGTYYSATNPSDLAVGLSAALGGVSARLGSAAAASTSTAFIVQGDNFIFHSTFVSQQWTGDLQRQQIDPASGNVLPTIDWSAQAKLDPVVPANRNIYFFNGASANNLSSFLWANLSAAQQSYFSLADVQTYIQSCLIGATCLSAADQALAAGANMVNYIRGDNTHAGPLSDNTKYYRQRLHTLGDIVNSESVYVRLPVESYTDPGFAAFQASTAITSRHPMVYAGANDGMLHAFRALDDPSTPLVDEGGQEDWAYIPTFVMPNLYKLGDKDYGVSRPHQYYVDGSPAVGSICTLNCTNSATAVWKTILVGGLNLGGRGYYALDITDPTNPKALWEFTNNNMGYSFGNPKIVKKKDGTWVVLVTSGYNNVPPDAPLGDGMGHLYVLNAYSGALINDISTNVGSTATPSGLGRIDTYLSNPGIDATTNAVYGGDLLGNVWRFDINGADTQSPARWTDLGAPGFDAQLLATLKDSLGNAQPITSKPLLSLAGTTLMVMIGTGRYLGSSDLADTSQQSFYAMKDPFTAGTTPSVAIWGNPRTQGTFVQQLQAIGTCPPGTLASVCTAGSSVTLSTNRAVNLSTNGGWYFDFARAGERLYTDPDIVYGTIVMSTNVPSSSSCLVGGQGFMYFINYLNGAPPGSALVPNSNLTSQSGNLPPGWGGEVWGVNGQSGGNATLSNPNVIYLPDGTVRVCYQDSAGGSPICHEIPPPNSLPTDPRRTSWRELVQ